MKPSFFFSLEFCNFLPNSVVWSESHQNTVFQSTCQSPFHEFVWKWNSFAGILLQKHQCKIVTVCKWHKIFKWQWLKIRWEFIIMQLARKFGYFYDTKPFKIITRITSDNIPGHIRFLGISYNFENSCINNIHSYTIT